MRKLTLVLLFISIVSSSSQGHQDTAKVDSVQKKPMLVKAAYVVGASLAFSLFDYVGYSFTRPEGEHFTRRDPALLSVYRVLQVAVQSAITYFLYKECGLSSAISFNLIWWTWGDDLAFNGWGYLFDPVYPPWANRENNDLRGNAVKWAGWTPIGLTRRQGTIIPTDVLIPQAIVGFSISMAILQF